MVYEGVKVAQWAHQSDPEKADARDDANLIPKV